MAFSISVEDCENNDGTQEKPFFMSERLMLILRQQTLADNEPNGEMSRFNKLKKYTRVRLAICSKIARGQRKLKFKKKIQSKETNGINNTSALT